MAFLRCPFTKGLMCEPAALEDGQVCERKAIEEWFRRGFRTSPLTGLALRSLELTPVAPLQRMVERHQEQSPIENAPDLDQAFIEEAVTGFQSRYQIEKPVERLGKTGLQETLTLAEGGGNPLGEDLQANRVPGLVTDLLSDSLARRSKSLQVLENLVIFDHGDRIINHTSALAIRNVGGIRALTVVLQEGTRLQQESAAFILWKVAIEENEFSMLQAGAPRALHTILEDGTPRAKMHAQNALTALEALQLKRRLQVQLKDGETDARIPELVAKLSNEDSEQVEDALNLLILLAGNDPDNPIAMNQCNAIPPIMKLLQKSSMKQRESAAVLLLGITVPSNELDIRKAGAIEALRLLDFEGPASAQFVAKKAIDELVKLEAERRFTEAQQRALWPRAS